MTKIQAQLYGMQTQQGVPFRDLLALKIYILGSKQAYFQVGPQRRNRFGSGDLPFSVRRGSYPSIILEAVYSCCRKTTCTKNRGKNRIGLYYDRRGP